MIKKVSGGGQSLHPELDANSEIKALTPAKKNEDGLLLNIPVNLIIDEVPLEKGFYKGKVRESETNNDFD